MSTLGISNYHRSDHRFGHEEVSLSHRVAYVRGLPHGTSDYELRDLFGTYGTVASAAQYKHGGKSAGYRFVELMSGEQALRPIAISGWRRVSQEQFVMP
jgi:RNA recognition motif-containing protein